jgi:hypothetical protein
MRRGVCFLLAVAALSVFGASNVSADYDGDYDDDAVDDTRLYGGLWLGFGGDAEIDGDNQFAGDLETTVGGQIGLDQVMSRYFSLGGEVRFGRAAWKAFNSKLIDIDVKPRLRLPLRRSIELYAAVPVGVTIPRLDDALPEGKTGWNIGAGAGINLFLTDNFGLNAEPMWIMHDFDDYRIKQFSLFLNAVLAL